MSISMIIPKLLNKYKDKNGYVYSDSSHICIRFKEIQIIIIKYT